MGGGASRGVTVAVVAASPSDLQAAVAGLSPEAREKLQAALAGRSAAVPVALATAPSACEVLRQIHSGEKACTAVITEYLDRITAVDGVINSCPVVADRSFLLERAAQVDAKVKAGKALRPLEGLPMVVKLNIDTKGMLTSASTAALKGHRPAANALVWQRLEAAGAICIAKANMPELAMGKNGYNPLHGHCWNPHAPSFAPGGSSSGTAAAIAAGLAPCGLGSDTVGSLRLPAEICGCVGMRPSKGRYPGSGVVPLGRQDTAGPMGRTVADLALIDAVMAGEALTAAPSTPLQAAQLKGQRVLVPGKWLGELAPGTRAGLDLAIAALQKAGAVVEQLEESDAAFAAFDAKLEGAEHAKFGAGRTALKRCMDAYLASHRGFPGLNVTAEDVAKGAHWTNALIGLALLGDKEKEFAALSDVEAEKALEPFKAEKAELEAAYAKYLTDSGAACLLTPCTRGPPINNVAGDAAFDKLEAAAAAAIKSGDMGAKIRCTRDLYMPAAITHDITAKMIDLAVPSIAVPTAARHEVGGDSLPAGVLLWGAPRGDKRLLELGVALEAALAAA